MNQEEGKGGGAGREISHLLMVKPCRTRVNMDKLLGIMAIVDLWDHQAVLDQTF